MMQLVRNPKLLIIFRIVQHSIVDILFLQFVYNLNLVEIDHGPIGSTTRDICDHISLDADAHLDELLEERDAEVDAGLAEGFLQHTEILVDAHVALLYFVEAGEH